MTPREALHADINEILIGLRGAQKRICMQRGVPYEEPRPGTLATPENMKAYARRHNELVNSGRL